MQTVYEGMYLDRFIGTILRNKGLKPSDQITDPRKFYRFTWEKQKTVTIPTKTDWAALDKKYSNVRNTRIRHNSQHRTS